MPIFEFLSQPIETPQTRSNIHIDQSASQSIRRTSGVVSLLHRRCDDNGNSSETQSRITATSGNDKDSAIKDEDGKNCSRVTSAATASGASSLTQNTTTSSQKVPPPPYSALSVPVSGVDSPVSLDSFCPTLQLQIDSAGQRTCLTSSLFNSEPHATSIHIVDDNAAAAAAAVGMGSTSLQSPAFISLRKSRYSSTCSLVAGAGFSSIGNSHAGDTAQHHSAATSDAALRILSITTYRFGLGRPPRINIGGNLSATCESSTLSPWDSFEVQRTAIWSRSQRIRTRLGTFEWRYASRAERKALSRELVWLVGAGTETNGQLSVEEGKKKKMQKADEAIRKHHDVKSLMVLEQVVQVFGSTDASVSSAAGPHRVRRPVARFIRSAQLRTPGSSRCSAGNGGRLQIDLRKWEGAEMLDHDVRKQTADDSTNDSYDREMLIVIVVSTVVCMLKKEIDRLENTEAAAISAAVS